MRRNPDRVAGRRDRTIAAPIERVADGPDGRSRFKLVISTQEVARDGDVILQAGWMFENFMRNPVLMWAHGRTGDPPIGRVVGEPKLAGGKRKPRTEAVIEFAREDEGSPLGAQVEALMQSDFIRANSVGFIPHARLELSDEERAGWKLGPWGQVWSETELLELSICCVGADAGALKTQELTLAACRALGHEPDAEAMPLLLLVDDTVDRVVDVLEADGPSVEDDLAAELLTPSLERHLENLVETLPAVVASEVLKRIETELETTLERVGRRAAKSRHTSPDGRAPVRRGMESHLRAILNKTRE